MQFQDNLESILVENISAYRQVFKTLTSEQTSEKDRGLIHPFVIEKYYNLIFNLEKIHDKNYINGLTSKRAGQGRISFKLKHREYKRITLQLYYNDYEKNFIKLNFGNKEGHIPLTENKELLENYIKQFMEM